MSVRIGLSIMLFFLALNISLYGQENYNTYWGHYQLFQENPVLDTARKNELYIRFNNASFFKNNEYKNEFVKGRSLTGLFFEPSIDFYTGSNTMIRTGVHLMKFHGTDEFDRFKPIISLQHQVNPNFSVLFGTIYGTSNHGLLEPLVGFENHLTNHYENGMQFLFTYPNFRADFWLNWEQFIHPGDPFQEHFTAGGHMLFPFVNGERWKLNADIQMLFRHKGGEVDSSDLPAGTQSNFTEGLTFKYLFRSKFLRSFSLEHYNIGFFEINPGGHLNITEGYTQYSLAGLDTEFGAFQLGYWSGTNFYGPHSEPLFLSQSQYQADYYSKSRKMLTLKYQVHWSLTDYLDIALRFEPYYHFDTGRTDHSWSIYLLLDKDFFLTNFKRR